MKINDKASCRFAQRNITSAWTSLRPSPAPEEARKGIRGRKSRQRREWCLLPPFWSLTKLCHRTTVSSKCRQLVSWSKYSLTLLASDYNSRLSSRLARSDRRYKRKKVVYSLFRQSVRLVEFASIISRAVPSDRNRAAWITVSWTSRRKMYRATKKKWRLLREFCCSPAFSLLERTFRWMVWEIARRMSPNGRRTPFPTQEGRGCVCSSPLQADYTRTA